MHTESTLNASSRSLEQSILDEKLNDCWGFCGSAYIESTTHRKKPKTNNNSVNKPSDDYKHGMLKCYTSQK